MCVEPALATRGAPAPEPHDGGQMLDRMVEVDQGEHVGRAEPERSDQRGRVPGLGDGQGFIDRDRPLRDAVGERGAVDQFEHERPRAALFLDAVDLGNAGVVQPGEDLGFALEPGGGGADRENRRGVWLGCTGPACAAMISRSRGRQPTSEETNVVSTPRWVALATMVVAMASLPIMAVAQPSEWFPPPVEQGAIEQLAQRLVAAGLSTSEAGTCALLSPGLERRGLTDNPQIGV